MARPRSPGRDKARQLWLESGKSRLLKSIAEELQVSEEQVRKWKNQDKWDLVTLPNGNGNVTKQKRSITNKKEERITAVAEEVKEVLDNTDLTDKQQLFCLHYVRCFNATKAYLKAYGCSYETALTNGPALLRNARVKGEIKRLKQGRFNREMLDENDIFQKYMDIAFADITDYVEFGQYTVPVMGPFGPITVKDDETGEKREIQKEVNVIRFKESSEVDGTLISEIKQGKDGASIKLADRLKALDWLSNHMNLATPEQKARIKKLEAETERILTVDKEDEDDGVVIIDDLPK